MSDFMVLSSSKSPEGEGDSSSSPTETKLWSLEDLNDDLLIEILTRLPTAKSAFSLTTVCRKWRSLISSNPCFVTKFIKHHMSQKSSYDPYYSAYQNPPTDFIRLDSNPQPFFIPHADYKTYDQESPPPVGYTLEFLPEERNSVSLLASSNDLLFCKAKQKDSADVNYYICNPITMETLPLPPPPARGENCTQQSYGLVCAPIQRWHQQQQQQQEVQYDFRFRAVRITWSAALTNVRPKHSFVDVYCSETRQWSQSTLLGAQYRPRRGNIVPHDGRLHWSRNGLFVAAYDPFNDEAQTIVFEKFEFLCLRRSCLGVCRGSLRLMLLTRYLNQVVPDHLDVWELEDYENKKMSLKHKIYFNSVQNSLIHGFVKGHMIQAWPLGFHPNDKDVVYIFLEKNVIAWRIRGGELQVVGEIREEEILENSAKSLPIIFKVFTTALPWWPTLINFNTPA